MHDYGELFGAEGPLATAIPGFATREEQIAMAEQVALAPYGLCQVHGRFTKAWTNTNIHPDAVMLSRRNQAWADQIQSLLAGSGTAFISVGAGHLAGVDSLQAQLEQRGVRVERIRD